MTNRVWQFKVTLQEISPPIWRRILVPQDYSFWDLHVAIQDAMGWLDYHLHLFTIRRKHAHSEALIGIPNDDFFDEGPEFLPGWDIPMSAYFNDLGVAAKYEYDFGDSWHHEVLLEGYLVRKKGEEYPQCISGARACPPEDCGGVPGYYRLLEIIGDPTHEEHEDMNTWLGGSYDPEAFDPQKVKFDNPKKRFRKAFSDGY